MTTTSNRAPSVMLCRLYQKKSEKGNVYFAGRLGAAKVVLLRSKDTGDDGSPIWNLLASEAPQKRQDTQEPARPSHPAPADDAHQDARQAARRDYQRPIAPDDAIPF